MSDRRRAGHRSVAAGLGVAALAAVGFAAAYTAGADTQLMGGALALAFAGLAWGLAEWARRLLPAGGQVEHREDFDAPRERYRMVTELAGEDAAGPGGPSRRGLARLLGLAVAAVGIAALFPVRSLLPPRRPDPVTALSDTPWRGGGLRLVTVDGEPVRPAAVTADTVLTVFPEGHPVDIGDAPAFLVRLDPARFTAPPPAGHVQGVVAYSLLCTHAGCPVAIYEEGTGRMFCPCHQSAFDLLAAARPVAGPAARPLPGLPIEVGPDGYLRATGDFTGPPGPGFWSRP